MSEEMGALLEEAEMPLVPEAEEMDEDMMMPEEEMDEEMKMSDEENLVQIKYVSVDLQKLFIIGSLLTLLLLGLFKAIF
jgi:hypothetical protein